MFSRLFAVKAGSGLRDNFAKAIRDTGIALDKFGARLQGNFHYTEELCRHRRVMSIGDFKPSISQGAWIAPNASVIGRVNLGEKALVWYGAVLRGDIAEIKIGKNTTIGDRAVIHVSSKPPNDVKFPAVIGNNCIIEHGAMIHACNLEDGCKVESGAMVLDGAIVGKDSIVGAGSLVVPGQNIPSGEYWAGTPAKFVRKVSEEDKQTISNQTQQYYALASKHDEFHTRTEEQKEKQYNPYFDPTANRIL